MLSTTTQYYLNGSQILASKDNFGWIYYDYDATGKVVSVNYYGTTYYYVHNLQGDVIALTDANGAIAVEYEYDPWGISGQQTYEQFLQGFLGKPDDWDMPFGFIIYPN